MNMNFLNFEDTPGLGGEVWTASTFTALLVYSPRVQWWSGDTRDQGLNITLATAVPTQQSSRSKIKSKPIISIVYLHCFEPTWKYFSFKLIWPNWCVSSTNTTTGRVEGIKILKLGSF